MKGSPMYCPRPPWATSGIDSPVHGLAKVIQGGGRRLRKKAAVALVAQLVTVVPDRDDLAVMQQSVEDGHGCHRVAKDLPPFVLR